MKTNRLFITVMMAAIFSCGNMLAQNAQAPKNLCGYGRGSKIRTHGTRFWRPLLYQLSYPPIGIC